MGAPPASSLSLLFCFLCLSENVLSAPVADDVLYTSVVDTVYGKVRGLRRTHNGQPFEEFKGMPFAKPPVDALRWKRPQAPNSWQTVRYMTNYSKPCAQLREDSGEDCLYLNVFVPKGVGKVKNLPVMVYAYGGGFILGGAQTYPFEELALTGQVVGVTFNYRVSALGGLSTSDVNARGNYHLWDARAALLWIRDNIENFGGDPSRVTLFGQSAGAVLTSHMVLSPLTDGLIHRAIALSGTSASTIGLQHQSRQNAINLARWQDCPVSDMRLMVECLRGKDARDLDFDGYLSMALDGTKLPGWLPTVDGEMVLDIPRKTWEKGGGSNVDYLLGRTEDDLAGFVYANLEGVRRNFTINLAADKELLDFIISFLIYTYAPGGDTDKLLATLKRRYPGLKSDDELTRTRAVSQMGTDWAFASPAHFEAGLHSRNSKKTGRKTFLYNFKYRASFLHHAEWITATHSDCVHFVFGEPYKRDFRKRLLGEFSPADHQVKRKFMHYLANFAYTGDPNEGPHKVSVPWPIYNEEGKQYMEVNSEMTPKKEGSELLSRYDFWLKEWPKITLPDSPLRRK